MNRFGATLDAVDMQAAMGEVDGVPAQRDELGRPQAVPIRDQHHGGVAVAMAVLPGGSDQAGDLAIGQVLAGADLGIALAPRRALAIGNCPNNGGRRHQRQMRIFPWFFRPFLVLLSQLMSRLRDTAQGEKRRFYGHNCNFGRGGRTGQHARDAELAGIFCRRAQPTPPQQWPARLGEKYCNATTAGCRRLLRFTGEFF